jgi:hypothetical protein
MITTTHDDDDYTPNEYDNTPNEYDSDYADLNIESIYGTASTSKQSFESTNSFSALENRFDMDDDEQLHKNAIFDKPVKVSKRDKRCISSITGSDTDHVNSPERKKPKRKPRAKLPTPRYNHFYSERFKNSAKIFEKERNEQGESSFI